MSMTAGFSTSQSRLWLGVKSNAKEIYQLLESIIQLLSVHQEQLEA